MLLDDGGDGGTRSSPPFAEYMRPQSVAAASSGVVTGYLILELVMSAAVDCCQWSLTQWA